MITIKNRSAIRKMEQAGLLLGQIFDVLEEMVLPGVSTLEIDSWIEARILNAGLTSRMKGFRGYKHVSCISVNDEVVHGVPSKRILQRDDLVTVDVCASLSGYCADMARMFYLGTPSEKCKNFIEITQRALEAGIEQVRPGNRISDISAAIQRVAEDAGYGIVREFAGHGIGRYMHEDPEILNYGEPGRGPVLRPGMAFAIEPMFTMGSEEVYIAHDGWTAKTKDGSLAAHVEDTVVVTQDFPLVITRKLNSAEKVEAEVCV